MDSGISAGDKKRRAGASKQQPIIGPSVEKMEPNHGKAAKGHEHRGLSAGRPPVPAMPAQRHSVAHKMTPAETEQVRREQRREWNRANARKSRLRKKFMTDSVTTRVELLGGQNDSMRGILTARGWMPAYSAWVEGGAQPEYLLEDSEALDASGQAGVAARARISKALMAGVSAGVSTSVVAAASGGLLMEVGAAGAAPQLAAPLAVPKANTGAVQVHPGGAILLLPSEDGHGEQPEHGSGGHAGGLEAGPQAGHGQPAGSTTTILTGDGSTAKSVGGSTHASSVNGSRGGSSSDPRRAGGQARPDHIHEPPSDEPSSGSGGTPVGTSSGLSNDNSSTSTGRYSGPGELAASTRGGHGEAVAARAGPSLLPGLGVGRAPFHKPSGHFPPLLLMPAPFLGDDESSGNESELEGDDLSGPEADEMVSDDDMALHMGMGMGHAGYGKGTAMASAVGSKRSAPGSSSMLPAYGRPSSASSEAGAGGGAGAVAGPLPSPHAGPGAIILNPDDYELMELVASSRQHFIITDATLHDNPIAFASAGFHALTGYSRNDIFGFNCRFLQGPGSDRGTVNRIRTAVTGGRDVRAVILNYTKSGQAFWNELFIAPLKDASGAIVHFVGVQNAISPEKAAVLLNVEAERARAATRAKARPAANGSAHTAGSSSSGSTAATADGSATDGSNPALAAMSAREASMSSSFGADLSVAVKR